jgi:hypothetical protein
MKAPACVRLRWGEGTVEEKKCDTESAKKMEAQLKALQQARETQDLKWAASATKTTIP